MKKFVLLLLILPCTVKVFCQKNKQDDGTFYMLDANYKSTTEKMAVYFIHAVRENDTCWQFDEYNMSGPLISSEQFKDNKGRLSNGYFSYFNKKGNIDSAGNYSNGLKDGAWIYYNSTGTVATKNDFILGRLVHTREEAPATIHSQKINRADSFVVHITDSTHIEVPPSYPGGSKAWTKYLEKNFNYPQTDVKKRIQGEVTVQFVVDTSGKIINPVIVKSVEYFLDEEALRLVKNSPDWLPAMLDFKKIKSARRQSIHFNLQ